ncbi:hypothetical protein acsn021_33960 [Anaerocolumna cellulosilytica]|uniref:Uncharacterized protein n=1 Tax=Anaerocolumna cellulosilytica TaxID=433286 RepID=A0A6S6R746_9FIRM|nr:ClbS/DfsB family four-helix bundle protein [Anaerocolumna cellulosilytica]MBB5196779.1 hypothetical protein [Anaerocolumna cellulosilytica]BCJ95827.1 hypothetical protein acsn021_33960 [Anaerocolumna cellulosilytica]
MREYTNKNEMILEIRKTADLFEREFDVILETEKDIRVDDVDKTPQEMIAYQLGWLNLITGWEEDEKAGREVITPAPGFKWNELGALYQSFYEKYKEYSLLEMRNEFKRNVEELISWLEQVEDKAFFQPGIRKWTITNANWPMWKWVHINTVAPFKSFRSKIRKWKKCFNTTA